MTVRAVDLPASSKLNERYSEGDFVDCYAGNADISPRRAAEIITQFPGWARFLLIIRKLLTSPFGLSQGGPEGIDKVGPFPVETETENELIAGFNDRHLNFRISVLRQQGKLHLATWVRPHNFAGRFYLNLIMPFHILIARNGISRVMRATSKQA